MVRLERETSNTLADDLFGTLEDWNKYLQAENIDFSDLSRNVLDDEPDEQAASLVDSLSAQPETSSPRSRHRRKHMQGPQP